MKESVEYVRFEIIFDKPGKNINTNKHLINLVLSKKGYTCNWIDIVY